MGAGAAVSTLVTGTQSHPRRDRVGGPPAIGDSPSAGTLLKIAGAMGPMAAATAVDRVRRWPMRTNATVPGRIESLTAAFLNRVLRPHLGAARVEALSVERHSSGTSVRARLLLHYSAVGDPSRLPKTIFVKSAPTLVTRISNGLSGTAPAEAGFYNELRPLLELEAPHGYYSATQRYSYRAIHLLEDLVGTRAATFCTPTTAITRQQADDIVMQLAQLHAKSAKLIENRHPPWLRTYPQWWQATGAISMIRRYHLRGQRRADEMGLTPARLVGRGEQLWRSFEASVDAHDRLPRTLIHGDTHLGNWYITGKGRMGLCDWQCISAGHWSRDLSYALSSALSIEQRREWEDALIATYLDRLADAGGQAPPRAQAREMYRQQLPGALAMWTTTLYPPKFLPEMQPEETAAEMLRRILTAIDDHDVLRGR
ncbi:phosphotransferase [Mycolicibacterium moriokaense]|uniref:Aminoglycoside phosphotransferase n=1 Tax=Mycolicibacterium moriokaense TaxID=39691 RepID=A0AAD1H6N5_9MYCO|nr:phosphotransferase [Mycolicibacterium moriokaense]MCV7037969.1 phosphotransferase [Mycolicibacterium moriokaense]BBW99589.1 aminoglycoside phosphotransferase [Mycolicibacterium moriokaense]